MAEFLHHNLKDPLPEKARKGVIAIGNFDGMHQGHQAVLQQARTIAEQKKSPCYALSFEPHPRTLFRPDHPVFRLTSEDMKARILKELGMDGLLILPFTKALAATSADDFVARFLLQQGGASHIISGFNFHFGKDRQGSPEFLIQSGQKNGFDVTIVDALGDADKEPVSSSRIRRHLGDGNVQEAAQLLAYRWAVAGEVVKGAQLGRTLGFPTANLALAENCHLAHGIYAVRVRRADGRLYDGVASFGRRPTFDNGAPLLETYLFDFSDDLYGEEITVSLFAYLRKEIKFDDIDSLVVQMKKDAAEAFALLEKVEPLTPLDKKLTFDKKLIVDD